MKIRLKPHGKLFEIRYNQRKAKPAWERGCWEDGVSFKEAPQEYTRYIEYAPRQYYIDDQEVSQSEYEASYREEAK